MPNKLWRWIERVSWWLENSEERQAVLGDIQEIGVTFRALWDLIILVLLRQLRGWKSWKPWALTAFLLVQLLFLVVPAVRWSVPVRPWSVNWIDLIQGILTPFILAYGVGFALGSLGKRRTLTVLPLAATLPLAYSVLVIRQSLHNAWAWGIKPIFVFLAVLAVFAVLPFGFGLHQGLRGDRFGRLSAIAISVVWFAIWGYWIAWIIRLAPEQIAPFLAWSAFFFWPIFYALGPALLPARPQAPTRFIIDP